MQEDLLNNIKRWWASAFNLAILQKSRLAWVDYLKGIAIILVVYRHVLDGLERSGFIIPSYLVNANMIFFSFRMPLFFILSGIFISASLSKRSLAQVSYIKFETLLYPYLIWSFLQITLQIIFSPFTNSERTIADYAYILYQPRNLDQFWYLPALFNATIVYLLIKTKFKPPNWVQLILGILLYFLSRYVQSISMLSDWMAFYLFFALGDAISTFFFKESTQRFLKNPLSLLAITPVFLLVQLYYLSHPEEYYSASNLGYLEFLFIALVGCISMFILAFRMQSWNVMAFLRVLGFHSLYIYVMHILIAGVVRIFLTKILGVENVFVLLFSGILFGVSLPVVLYNLLIHENIGWFLFSLKKRSINSQSDKGKPPGIVTSKGM